MYKKNYKNMKVNKIFNEYIYIYIIYIYNYIFIFYYIKYFFLILIKYIYMDTIIEDLEYFNSI